MIRDLDFFYGPTQALNAVTLDIPEKQVTGMIGPSGCGKTTLLRVLNRLYDMYPDERVTGEALMDGRSILGPEIDLNLLRWRIGMVFQRPTPFRCQSSRTSPLGRELSRTYRARPSASRNR